MDQRAEPIEQDIAAIRDSMSDKMGQIEDRIRSSVEETGESLKRSVDLRYQVEERPWAMVGGAIVLGYVVGNLSGTPEQALHTPAYRPQVGGHPNGQPQHESGPLRGAADLGASLIDDLKEQFSDELALVKTVAISAAVTFLQDAIRESFPSLADKLDRARQTQSGHRRPAAMASASPRAVTQPSISSGDPPMTNSEAIPTATISS
jgi:ElaB/YqjD/DUF883 family membrane-anchored ribosome-binding protein